MKKLWIAIPTAIAVAILNVLLFVLFMILYGRLVNPGHDDAFYQTAANSFGPLASIVSGIPLMFLGGYLVSRRLGGTDGMVGAFLVWVTYFLLDLVITSASGQLLTIFPLFFASFATKLLAVLAGGQYARGRVNR